MDSGFDFGLKSWAMASLENLAAELRDATSAFARPFALPGVPYVYAPLEYAWSLASSYLRKFGKGKKRVVLVGMNPGPFGMGQTGVPFGEVSFVRDWMKLSGDVSHPAREHPKRPILGLSCARSEVSGKRLWGAVAKAHPDARTFFADAFVLNYCPLLFLSDSGANLTPDKLPKAARARLESICDEHLRAVLGKLAPEIAIGVGGYAAKKIASLEVHGLRCGVIPHPSPASPAANKDWEGQARRALDGLGAGSLLRPRVT